MNPEAGYVCPGCGGVSQGARDRCPYCQSPFTAVLGSGASSGKTEADLRKRAAELEARALKGALDGPGLLELGKAYHGLGEYGKAAERLQAAAKLLPTSPDPWYWLAWNEGVRCGWQTQAVLDAAKQALSVDARCDRAAALIQLCLGVQSFLYERQDHVDAALEKFEEAIELDPENSYGHFYAGCAHELAGRYKEAAACFEEASSLSLADAAPAREDARLFARLGFLYYRLGKAREATRSLAEAVRLDPSNEAAQKLLAELDG